MTKTLTPEKAKEADSFARARAGNPYGFGGAFNLNPRTSTDCSGLVLQTGAFLQGRTDWPGNRYGSTESFRLDYKIVYDLGFKRMSGGRAPIETVMKVGLQHGGGGIYSHTACTLMFLDRPGGTVRKSTRGVDWESQGDGVFYYDGARAWNDRLFHDFWYLDMVLGTKPIISVNEITAEIARAKSWIGKRLDEKEVTAPDGEGKFVRCENGTVYWHPKVHSSAKAGEQAIAVPKAVMEVWGRQGWEKGPIGYPTQRHYDDKGVGVIQAFQRGAIYRKHGTKGGILNGKILDRYTAMKLEKGSWGYPLGDEEFYRGGRVQQFEKMEAYWHPSSVIEILDN